VYTHADMAYVGGGFRSGQLHATIEPACYALAIMVGPEYESSADAERLVRQGGAIALSHEAPAGACYTTWREWTESAGCRGQTGLRARSTLQQGAAGVTSSALLDVL
jgi:3-deoxy-D-manno-octulosonic-acid transferase